MNTRLLECPIALIQAPHPEKVGSPGALPNALPGAMKIDTILCDKDLPGMPWDSLSMSSPFPP